MSEQIGVSEPARAMYDSDAASRSLGVALDRAQPGSAETSMTIEARHCNGLGVCHGGFLFTLADTAMAFASNADGSGSFATNAEIDFVRPAHLGDHLVARCSTVLQRGKSAINDVTLENQDGEVIAVFRGRTLATGKPVGSPDQPTSDR